MPLYGHDIWLHAALALVAAYVGFMRRDDAAAGASASRGGMAG